MAASSSSCGPSRLSGQEDGIYLPKHLVEAVAQCRQAVPICQWFQKGSCRKGNKCKLQHGAEQARTLPHTSLFVKDDKPSMVVRVPLDKGWMQFFEAANQPRRVLPGGQRHTTRVMYQLAFMAEGDKVLQAKTINQQCVTAASGAILGACPKPFPEFLGHCTSLQGALEAVASGRLPPGNGSCGEGGIHGFRICLEDNQSLLDATAHAWDRAAAANPDFSCMFVLACNGCLINGNYKLEIPPGSIAVKEWTSNCVEYAAHPTSVDVVAVMFEFEGLTQRLLPEIQKADPEYTKELHSSLMACQEWLRSRRGDEQAHVELVKLANAVTMSGGQEVQEARKALKAQMETAKLEDTQRTWKQKRDSWQSKGVAEERKKLQEELRQGDSTSSQQLWHGQAATQQQSWHTWTQQQAWQEWAEQQQMQQHWWTGSPHRTALEGQWQQQHPHEQASELQQPLRQPSSQLEQQCQEVQTSAHDELMSTLRENAKRRKEQQLFQ